MDRNTIQTVLCRDSRIECFASGIDPLHGFEVSVLLVFFWCFFFVFFWFFFGSIFNKSHSCQTESVVEPLQQRPPYYHMVFRRVPTIDQCYTDDLPCQYEAHEQYKRDRLVETKMVSILRKRYEDCLFYYGHDEAQKCFPLREEYRENELNWFIKCKNLDHGSESVLTFSLSPIRRRLVVLQIMRGRLLQASSQNGLGTSSG